jgi:phosphoribosylformylglycinamidine (FGAM) synthase-like enzyme
VVVSVSPASLDRVNAIAAQWTVRARKIGTVAKGDFRIEYNGNFAISGPLDSFRRAWAESLANAIENK